MMKRIMIIMFIGFSMVMFANAVERPPDQEIKKLELSLDQPSVDLFVVNLESQTLILDVLKTNEGVAISTGGINAVIIISLRMQVDMDISTDFLLPDIDIKANENTLRQLQFKEGWKEDYSSSLNITGPIEYRIRGDDQILIHNT